MEIVISLIRKMSLASLEKKAALQILSYLYRNESATRTALRKNIKAAMETVYSALGVLKELGLVEESVDDSFAGTKEAYLSEKGVTVAKRLVEIEEILESEE
jgi:DNA-binding transcriptional ArsR family regulator